jgi:regulator of sirC expression with transglutaminase-like and TPR domain
MVLNKEHKELDALISLLDEPNESMFSTIRDRIFSYGPIAIPLLEQAWDNAFEPVIQHRIEDLIHQIHHEDLKREIRDWSLFHNEDLLRGAMLVNRHQYPDINQEALIKQVGQITQDVWLELNANLTGLEKVKVMNHILFETQRFSGNVSGSKTPEAFYLNKLLETKKGSALSLGILYVIIAQGLKVPIYGVDLPRHFVLAYMDQYSVTDPANPGGDVLFYINPFNKGAIFTRNEVELFVKQLKVDPKDSFFKPCDNKTIIRRLTAELAGIYDESGNPAKCDEIKELGREVE